MSQIELTVKFFSTYTHKHIVLLNTKAKYVHHTLHFKMLFSLITSIQGPGVNPTKLFSNVNKEFFHFFATKLGCCTVHTFFHI